jgi:hypothetical protein
MHGRLCFGPLEQTILHFRLSRLYETSRIFEEVSRPSDPAEPNKIGSTAEAEMDSRRHILHLIHQLKLKFSPSDAVSLAYSLSFVERMFATVQSFVSLVPWSLLQRWPIYNVPHGQDNLSLSPASTAHHFPMISQKILTRWLKISCYVVVTR